MSGLKGDSLQSERVFACEIVQRRILDAHEYVYKNDDVLAHEN